MVGDNDLLVRNMFWTIHENGVIVYISVRGKQ